MYIIQARLRFFGVRSNPDSAERACGCGKPRAQ